MFFRTLMICEYSLHLKKATICTNLVAKTQSLWATGKFQARGTLPPPRFFSPRNFCWPTGKKGARKKVKKGKMGRTRSKSWQGRGVKLKMEGEKVWKQADYLFFFFFACHFLKSLKFVLFRVPKWTILLGKIIFYARKNQKNWLCPPPLKNIPITPLLETPVFVFGFKIA